LRDERLPYLRSTLVPLEELARLLITPHAHLITLSDAFVGYVLPSKSTAASNKPILFIGVIALTFIACAWLVPAGYNVSR
jgi:hypothetical protein